MFKIKATTGATHLGGEGLMTIWSITLSRNSNARTRKICCLFTFLFTLLNVYAVGLSLNPCAVCHCYIHDYSFIPAL